MVGHKQILCALVCIILSGVVMAQNNTNSPYTRYGYGELSPQTFSKSRGMGGVAYGLRDGYHINATNPASYTMVDSLTFLFDGGFSVQNANLSDGTTKKNAGNSSFDYVAMQFRLHKRMAMTMGLLPYSNVGYSFYDVHTEDSENAYSITHSGEGGLHQAFVGVGFKVLNNLSVGVNASYFWGDISRKRTLYFSGGDKYNYVSENYLSVSDFKLDLGVQYTQKLDAKRNLTMGAVFSPKRNLSNDAYLLTQTALQGSSGEYLDYNIEQRDTVATFSVPMNIGVGVAYQYDNRLTIAADYTFQNWSKAKYMDAKSFYNMNKIALGIEYLPSHMGRSYVSYIKYRLGGYYSTPYYKVQDRNTGGYYRASGEYGLTAGLALPFPRTRTVLSLSAQYVNISGKRDMMDEKYMRLCVGLTFNERWFFKRKVD